MRFKPILLTALALFTLTSLADAAGVRFRSNVAVRAPGVAVNVGAVRGVRVDVGRAAFRNFHAAGNVRVVNAPRTVVFRQRAFIDYAPRVVRGIHGYAGATYAYAAPPASYPVPAPAPVYNPPAAYPSYAPEPGCTTGDCPAPAPAPAPMPAPAPVPSCTYTPPPAASYGCCGGGAMSYAPSYVPSYAPPVSYAPAYYAPSYAPSYGVSYAPSYGVGYGVGYSAIRSFAPAYYSRGVAFGVGYRSRAVVRAPVRVFLRRW